MTNTDGAEALHARGKRREWSELPRHIVEAIESFLGDRIVLTKSISGGFSPGIASTITTVNGRTAFVKAVSASVNHDAAKLYRREAIIATSLRDVADLPVPRLLWTLDAGRSDWVVLMFECLDGHMPVQPWLTDELDLVVSALNRLSRQLTPSPVEPPIVPLVSADTELTTNYWEALIESPNDRLDSWSMRHLGKLAMMCRSTVEAISGETLLHADLRADNMLVYGNDVWIVDWPHACIGASWLDPLFMAPSVTMHGGPLPEAFFARFPDANTAEVSAVDVALAAVAGYFTGMSLQPEVPVLPGLRAFQAAQAKVARDWLARRLNWD